MMFINHFLSVEKKNVTIRGTNANETKQDIHYKRCDAISNNNDNFPREERE